MDLQCDGQEEGCFRPPPRISLGVIGIVVAYLIAGSFWAIFSHDVIAFVVHDPGWKREAELGIGIFVVLASGGILLLLIQRVVAARRGVEGALRRSEANYRAIFEAANDALFVHDLKTGVIIDVNRKMCEMYGYTPEEVRQLDVEAISTGEPGYTQADALRWIHAAAAAPQLFEWRCKTKEGHTFWAEVSLKKAVIGGEERILAVVRDISERKQAEEALRESEERYRDIFENATEGIFQSTVSGRYLHANSALARMSGYDTPEELIANVNDLERQVYVHPEDRQRLKRTLEEKGSISGFEVQMYRRDGSIRWILINAHVVRDRKGRIIFFEGTNQDVTERRLAQEALQESEAQKSTILDTVSHAVLILEDRKIAYANRGVEDVFGWKPEDLIGQSTRPLYRSDEDFERIGKDFYPLLEGQRTHREEFSCRRRDGREITCMVSASRIGDRLTRKRIVAVYDDITNQKEAERKLAQYSQDLEQMVEERTRELDRARTDLFISAKLAAMGRMGAGIAHQLNSPLGGAMLLLDTAAEECKRQSHLAGMLAQARKALESMRDIVDCMLAMAGVRRRGRGSQQLVDLNTAIGSILDILTLECNKRRISVQREFSPRIPSIVANVGELDQVFLNLVNNAIDAMEAGGQLTVCTRALPEGVEVRVADTGTGIDVANLDKIFEPFFTTRMNRRGLGLGLAIVREVVDRYGGEIEVETEMGKGSAFIVRLPQTGIAGEATPSIDESSGDKD